MGKAIGIDLGTTNSVVAYKDTNVRIISTGVNNEDLCRSCVALDKNDQFIVGNSAYENWKRYSPNIVTSVKRLMGASITDEPIQMMKNNKANYPYSITQLSGGTQDSIAIILKGKEYTPEDISAEILRSIKKDASAKLGEITHAVITVPAYFNEKQKNATKEAASLAGFHVQQLLAEPTAAAISYGFDKMEDGDAKQVLIYDFGGGTFDLSILSILDNQFIETASGGDRWLGGDDIDNILSNYICAQIEENIGSSLRELLEKKRDKEVTEFYAGLKKEIESAKKNLGQVEKVTILLSDYLEDEEEEPVDDIVITKNKFEALIRPLIQRTIDLIEDLLKKTNIPIDTIDNILLVGGSSCIPLVKQMLSTQYGEGKILLSEKPMLAIAEGAAILAQSLPCDDDAIKPLHPTPNPTSVVYTTKHCCYIQLSYPDGKTYMEKVIDSQEVLPLISGRKFKTVMNSQKIIEVKIFSDNESGGYDKLTSGFFIISENLPAQSDLNFTFTMDENELLQIQAKVASSGKISDVRLGRGGQDTNCLREISVSIEDVFTDNTIKEEKKRCFVDVVQSIVEDINKNNYSKTDTKWLEMIAQIEMAKNTARLGEAQENRLGEIFAQILINWFGKYLNDSVRNTLEAKLHELNSSDNSIQKEALQNELENYAQENYALLLNIGMFKLIGDSASDPLIAGQASTVYDELLEALDSGSIGNIHHIIQSNQDIMKKGLSDTDIDWGGVTGVGSATPHK